MHLESRGGCKVFYEFAAGSRQQRLASVGSFGTFGREVSVVQEI